MSGRWRSRHWRPEDNNSNNNNNMHRGDDYDYHDGHQFNRRDEEMSYQRHHHHHQQQQQQYQQPYDSSRYNNNYQQHYDYGTSMPQNNHHYHDHQPRRTAWQRGQSLPHQSRHHNNNNHHHDNNSRSTTSAPNRSSSNRNNNNGTSGVNNDDGKKNDHRATFTSAPVNAWGKKQPSQQDQQQQPSMAIKMEENQSASSTGGGTNNNAKNTLDGDAAFSTTTTTNTSAANTSAWKKKPNPPSSSAAASSSGGDNNVIIKTGDDKLFPSLVSSSVKKEDGASSPQQPHHHHGGADLASQHNSIQIKEEATIEGGDNTAGQVSNNNPSSSSLPSTSSWGKSHSSGWASKQQQPSSLEMSAKKKKKSSGEEFPSLSASLDAPRKQQPLHKTGNEKGGVLMVNTKKGGGNSTTTTANNNKNNNKKSATVANLASFLTPQLVAGGGTAKEKKKDGNNKKRPPSSNNNTNKSKKHPREETHIPLLQHPATASMVNISNTTTATAATITGAPPIKKGRQRLAPRKKKLSTLKKRVLEERLRIWKERNGHDDEVVDPSVSSVSAVNTVDGNDDINKTTHHQGINQCENSTLTTNNEKSATTTATTTLLVENFVNPKEDDLADNDEYDELVTNLISLAERVGKVVSVYIPRPKVVDGDDKNVEELTSSATKKQVDDGDGDGDSTSVSFLEESNHVGLSFVRLATHNDALAARDILEGMVVGGQKLCTRILYSKELQDCKSDLVSSSSSSSVVVHSEENERQWRLATLKAAMATHNSSSLKNEHLSNKQDDGNGNASSHQSPESIVIFHNILSSDDYEDEDALEESIEDIKSIASQYGQVVSAYGDTSSLVGVDGTRGNVYVAYDTNDIAVFAAQKLDGMLLGGVKISVSVGSSDAANRIKIMPGLATVVLKNVLSEDDFEDEDCLNESIADIQALAEKYGVVGNVRVDTSNTEQKGEVRVEYTGGAVVAEEAARQLNGILFGGKFISATILSSTGSMDLSHSSAPSLKSDATNDNVQQTSPQPMFSGNKVIPERFAECKRVPKVPNSGTPRAYATKIANDKAIPLLTEMLGELMRLQQRSKDDKNARSRRRLVMGLREVARGIRAHKVKMVIMANNLDEYGAIDSKLQEILDLSHSEDVPVVFELNKRKLGKAVGKSIKVSVVGIQNVSGAEQQFKQLKRMAGFT